MQEKSVLRFKVSRKGYCYFEVSALKEEDKNNDFVGEFEGLSSKEALLRVAKDGYGISEYEIQFIN